MQETIEGILAWHRAARSQVWLLEEVERNMVALICLDNLNAQAGV
jgi:hypothetical protein